jgi:hypothetical protein
MRKQFLRHNRALVASIWQTVLFYVASCGIVSTASIGIYKAHEEFIVKPREAKNPFSSEERARLQEETARVQEENAQLRQKLEVNEKVEQKLIKTLTYSELEIKYLHTAEAANAANDTARAKAALENVKSIEAAKEAEEVLKDLKAMKRGEEALKTLELLKGLPN